MQERVGEQAEVLDAAQAVPDELDEGIQIHCSRQQEWGRSRAGVCGSVRECVGVWAARAMTVPAGFVPESLCVCVCVCVCVC